MGWSACSGQLRWLQVLLVGLCLFSAYRFSRLNASLVVGDQNDTASIKILAEFVPPKNSHGRKDNVTLFDSINQQEPRQDVSRSNTSKAKTSAFSTSSFSKSPKFYILASPQVTTDLLLQLLQSNNDSTFPSNYYKKALNEESAEMWLYRGVSRLSYKDGQTHNASEADYFLLPGLLHLYSAIIEEKKKKKKTNSNHPQYNNNNYNRSFIEDYKNLIVDPTKPHLLLVPTWNPKVSRVIGVKNLAKALKEDMGVNLWSVGFERNHMWQHVSEERIIPIPYVVRLSKDDKENDDGNDGTMSSSSSSSKSRLTNFVFYAGDRRKNAKQWAGCHRDLLIEPLQNETATMDVRIVSKRNRLNQTEYNRLMSSSEYCLILCGDTPSSRSLTSAIVSGCIPIRVGSRLRGLCEAPCQPGFGWKPTGVDNPHLPYPNIIDWDNFPEVDEAQFIKSGKEVLQAMFQKYDAEVKHNLRSSMRRNRNAWVYGWGDPVTSEEFGGAATNILRSFHEAVKSRS